MSDALKIVMEALASDGQGATVLASVICRLVIDGTKLGSLDEREVIGIDGQPRTIKLPPTQWFDRLARAIELGVFDGATERTVRRVVDRILSTEAPVNT